MMPTAVRPMDIPISNRRRAGFGSHRTTGDSGLYSSTVNRQAETMKMPNSPASIQ